MSPLCRLWGRQPHRSAMPSLSLGGNRVELGVPGKSCHEQPCVFDTLHLAILGNLAWPRVLCIALCHALRVPRAPSCAVHCFVLLLRVPLSPSESTRFHCAVLPRRDVAATLGDMVCGQEEASPPARDTMVCILVYALTRAGVTQFACPMSEMYMKAD